MKKVLILTIILNLSILLTTASASTTLYDDFNGTSLDQTTWRLPTGPGTFFGRTQIKPPREEPVVSGGFVTLQLDTYNPTAQTPGDSFWGQEIQTFQSFSVNQGLSVKARMRYVGTPANGLVTGFFLFGLNWPIRDEIDFELLSNDLGDEKIFTNVFEDRDFNFPGINQHVTVSGLDITQFAEYEIRWLPDRVQWYVDGNLIREELAEVPDDPMEVRLNIWAPDQFFTQGYDAGLQPTSSASENQIFQVEVDFVEVSTLPEPGDIDGKNGVNLTDAVLVLQVLSGIQPVSDVSIEADVNNDGKIDLKELIYILQKVSGLR